jgi:hypothetical protein
MEKVDDGRSQGGILELTCGTKIAAFYGIFGMEIVDGKGEKQKDGEKCDIEVRSVSSGHRIPSGITISEKKGKSQRLVSLELDFESSVGGTSGRSVTFDQFVSLVQDVFYAEVKLNVRENIPGYGSVKQTEGVHLNSGRDPIDPFHVVPFPEVHKGKNDTPFSQKTEIQFCREFVFWPSQECLSRSQILCHDVGVGGRNDKIFGRGKFENKFHPLGRCFGDVDVALSVVVFEQVFEPAGEVGSSQAGFTTQEVLLDPQVPTGCLLGL